jgi:hypothetical protein
MLPVGRAVIAHCQSEAYIYRMPAGRVLIAAVCAAAAAVAADPSWTGADVVLTVPQAQATAAGSHHLADLADRAGWTLACIADLTGLAPPGTGPVQIRIEPLATSGHGALGGRSTRIAPALLAESAADPAAWDAVVAHELSHNADAWNGAPFSDRWCAGPDPAHAWTDFLTAYLLPVYARTGDRTSGAAPEAALAAATRRQLAAWRATGGRWEGPALVEAQSGALLVLAATYGPVALRAACDQARRRPPGSTDAARTAALIADWSVAVGADVGPVLAAIGVPVPGQSQVLPPAPALHLLTPTAADAWPLDLDRPGRWRIEVRSPPGGAMGWLTVRTANWTHRRWCLPGTDTAITAHLPAGPASVTLAAGAHGRAGAYDLVAGPAPCWPGVMPAPIVQGEGRLTARVVAPAGAGPGLVARWWHSAQGWIASTPATDGVAAIALAAHPGTIRAQWFRDGIPAWPISAATALVPTAPVGVN